MKILHTVESYLPSHHGMSEVVRQISERLVGAGHHVTVVTRFDPRRLEKKINGVDIVEFNVSGNITEGIQGEYDLYVRFLLESQYDIVTNFAAQQWATDLALPILPKIHGKKVFVPTGFSALYMEKYKPYFERMKEWLNEYDKVVYLSNDYRDVNFARELGFKNGILIPNGASEEEFSTAIDPGFKTRLNIPEQNTLVLHVAGYVGGKGHLDAIKIFRKAKLKQSSLLLVSPEFGDKFEHYQILNLSSLKSIIKMIIKNHVFPEYDYIVLLRRLQKIGLYSNIRFIELSRPEVVQAYKNADLFLFPSNIECSPIVLFECMAAKTPFLVTDVGNAREIVEWSKAGEILPTKVSKKNIGLCRAEIQKSSCILRKIDTDIEKKKTMSENGYNSWMSNFTWKKISKQYEVLYNDILS